MRQITRQEISDFLHDWLYSTETTSGWYGSSECREVADILVHPVVDIIRPLEEKLLSLEALCARWDGVSKGESMTTREIRKILDA